MATYEFPIKARNKLRDELEAAGIEATVEFDGFYDGTRWRETSRVWVTTEADRAAVEAVVAAHTATADEDAQAEAELVQFRQDRSRLRTFLDTPNANLTLPAVVIAVKALIRVVYYLVREARESNG